MCNKKIVVTCFYYGCIDKKINVKRK
uniref:Uncharacterized protein n=1 Tax=Anguilla anguilla TaxID=7936 RepID=A0A0E9VY42_ANGAN